MNKVLITGVAGFMGSHLADEFLKRGYKVVGIDNLIGGYKENVPDGVEFWELDLNDLDSLHEPFTGVDLVVHTACTAYEGLSVFSPALITRNTSQIIATVMSASIKAGVKKVVHMSSMARYGTQEVVPFTEDLLPLPQDPYGIAKYAGELLIKNLAETHGMDYVILVPHNIIGPRQKYDDPFRNVASIMINRMLQGKQPIIYGDGKQMRCFSFMQDVINPLMIACETDVANGMTINIGPDEEFVTIIELAEKLAKILDFDLDPIFMPGRPQEVKHANCSANKAREILGYKTSTTLEEGLTELVNWIKDKGAKPFNYHLPIEFITEKTPKTWTDKLM
ncbi:MAG: NAD-dependent epimerase/dehydratase family protein [Actinobacteria bacterium]|nr:NAD-dependent epimerase/dehydratase family protein [Actinomycetota bacterium]